MRRICIQARHWLHVFLKFSLAVPLYCFSLRLRRDSAQSSTACHSPLVWQFFRWWLWLELAPSAAVCGCSAASHQPQARRSTWKTLRTSLNMMGSSKHQLWSRSFPLKSKSWSLMHDNSTKNCLLKLDNFLFSLNDNLHWLFVWLGKACAVILEIAYKFCGVMIIVYISLIW